MQTQNPERADGSVETIRATCNSCGSSDADPLGQSPDFEYATCTGEFRFVRCRFCGLVYLKDRPVPSALNIIYPPNYIPYRFNEHLGPVIAHLRDFVQKGKIAPIRRFAQPGCLIVDVGCGGGEFLRLLKQHGDPSWRLMGVDF